MGTAAAAAVVALTLLSPPQTSDTPAPIPQLPGAIAASLPFAPPDQDQPPAPGPRFDVVSVKVEPPSGCPYGAKLPGFSSPDTWQVVCYPVSWILTFVLQVPENYMAGLPDWTTRTYVEIHAKLPPTATHAQLPQMLQAMFADRFGLVFHHAMQIHTVRWIEVAKGGPKLKPSAQKCTDDPNVQPAYRCCAPPDYVLCQMGLTAGFRPPIDCASLPLPRCGDVVSSALLSHPFGRLISGVGATMDDLAASMSANTSGAPWANHTGLTGRYDFLINADVRPIDSDSGPPSTADKELAIERAFQSQAGLMIHFNVTHKEPFPMVVIDHIALPTPD